MIRTLTGSILYQTADAVVVDVHGVGYEVFVPPAVLFQCPVGESVMLHTFTHVKEEALQLFGFSNMADREFFVMLIGVSGVGPKTALQVLRNGSGPVIQALRGSDVAFFQSIPRLGKKMAQKIIVELQSKVGGEGASVFTVPTPVVRDVEEALIGMGYRAEDIGTVLSKIDAEWTVEEALKWALKTLHTKA